MTEGEKVKKYQPSNGTEGMEFIAHYCDRCVFNAHYQDTQEMGTGCFILRDTFVYDVDDEKYPTQWIERDDGEPVCTEFVRDTPEWWRKRERLLERQAAIEAGQQDLFKEQHND